MLNKINEDFVRDGIDNGKPILTASNGRFLEAHWTDSLEWIGNLLYDTRKGEVVQFLEIDTADIVSRIPRDLASRWLSPDPKAAYYPNISPYAFALNNPVKFIDPSGGVVEDPEGNIIFTPTGAPQYVPQPGYRDRMKDGNLENWRAYEIIPGYILDNKGQRVAVQLVTATTVYKAAIKNRVLMVDTNAPLENLDASTNCTGLAFTKGQFVLDAIEVDNEFLSNEGYEGYDLGKVLNDAEFVPPRGDVALYKDKEGNSIHAEVFTGGTTLDGWPAVDAKGGVQQPRNGVSMLTTWDDWVNKETGGLKLSQEEIVKQYKLYSGTNAKNVTTQKKNFVGGSHSESGLNYGTMNGKNIRVVSNSDFEEIQREVQQK